MLLNQNSYNAWFSVQDPTEKGKAWWLCNEGVSTILNLLTPWTRRTNDPGSWLYLGWMHYPPAGIWPQQLLQAACLWPPHLDARPISGLSSWLPTYDTLCVWDHLCAVFFFARKTRRWPYRVEGSLPSDQTQLTWPKLPCSRWWILDWLIYPELRQTLHQEVLCLLLFFPSVIFQSCSPPPWVLKTTGKRLIMVLITKTTRKESNDKASNQIYCRIPSTLSTCFHRLSKKNANAFETNANYQQHNCQSACKEAIICFQVFTSVVFFWVMDSLKTNKQTAEGIEEDIAFTWADLDWTARALET